MAKNISDIRYEIQTDMPNCGTPQLDYGILRAATWFCEKTLIWRETLTAIDIVADTYLYDLTPTTGLVHSLYHVEYDDSPIQIKTEEYFDDKYKSTNWRDTESTASNYCYLTKDRSQIRLYPIPNTASTGALVVTVTLKPERDATAIPELLYTDYLDALVAGAKTYLLKKVEQPWANLEYSQYYEKEFRMWVGLAKRDIATGFGHIDMVS
jgi:hypothetical protein